MRYELRPIQEIEYPIYFKTIESSILIDESDVEITYETDISVFCLKVQNEIFMVRRNGLISWTGNSRATGPKQRLTRQPPEG